MGVHNKAVDNYLLLLIGAEEEKLVLVRIDVESVNLFFRDMHFGVLGYQRLNVFLWIHVIVNMSSHFIR